MPHVAPGEVAPLPSNSGGSGATLIRWHYLWYAGLSGCDGWRHRQPSPVAGCRNFTHVFSSLLWTGIDLLHGLRARTDLRVIDYLRAKPCSAPRLALLSSQCWTLSIISDTHLFFWASGRYAMGLSA